MMRQPIVVGVDASSTAAAAALFGYTFARATGARCQLVHAVPDPWIAELPRQSPQLADAEFEEARGRIRAALAPMVPAYVLDGLIVRAGWPADLIGAVARELRPQLIVLGGKHHSVLGRWLAGSTSLAVARSTSFPLLVTAGDTSPVRRVLVALDSSSAARPTLEAARRFTAAFAAELRVLSVIEPQPVIPESALLVDPTPYYDVCRDRIAAELGPLAEESGGKLNVRIGSAVGTIEDEAAAWRADVLVVGSHAKSWTQRLMLGSVSERLLNHLPTSLLVVPARVRRPVAIRVLSLVPAIS
jgi:nucleotide-binding universal stress UspA family protein